jgi:hypothetical protein
VARAPLAAATDTHWWSFTAGAAGTYEVRLGDLPRAYRLTVHYPGGSTSTTNSSTSDRVRTITLAAGARVDIAISATDAGVDPTRAYRIGVRAPATSSAFAVLAQRALQGHFRAR